MDDKDEVKKRTICSDTVLNRASVRLTKSPYQGISRRMLNAASRAHERAYPSRTDCPISLHS